MSSDFPCSTHLSRSSLEKLCIHQAFARQASLTPDSIAITYGAQNISYAELERRANRLANYLCHHGAGPEIRIALYLERGVDMVVAIIAVLKSGAAYVPIDLAYPAERIDFMLKDSAAAILITHSSLVSKLPAFASRLLVLDDPNEAISQQSESAPSPDVTRQNAAYVIYTSGSTGRPKGVIVTHNNVLRLFSSTEHWYGFSPSDVWPLFHSYAFDMSVWELWGSLLYGGRLVIVPFATTRSPEEFYSLLARENVTFLNQTPSAFRQLIWAAAKSRPPLKLALRFVTLGGEALELQSLKPWFATYGDQKPTVVNKYGITETTVHTTYRPIRQKDLDENLGSVIGVPIPDLTVHLLDDQLRPAPQGTPGEICVGGEGVARGYLNRPELTLARFVPDPFSTKAGATLYRSGDLAQMNARGEMEYLGRMDQQVKIRGFRIELGEIESALNRHPAVRESVVIALPADAGSETRLAAYYVPVKNKPVISALREHLQRTLPDYMVPAHFVALQSFPLTNNGKIDRRALPMPESSRPELAQDFVAPATDTERVLVEVWQQVLGIDGIGIHDNFFDLGGDSIRSIALISKAQEHGVHISLEQIFQSPTVAGLARCSTAGRQDREFVASTPFSLISASDRALVPDDAADAYPIARLQLGMFFRNDLNPASAIYHDIFSYKIEAPFREDLLRQALQQLINRHAILRTSFQLVGYSEPIQVVHKQATPELAVDDIRNQPSEEQQAFLAGWVEAEKRRPFNRSRAPLARWHVLQLSDSAFQLIFSFHHCCLDGWSLAAATTGILTDYNALIDGTSSGLMKPGLAYRDFISLERQSISSAACRQFWFSKLHDAPVHALPRWPADTRAGGQEQVRGPELFVDPAVFDGLKRLAQTCGVPLKTVLFAAHTRVMSVLHGQSDLTTGLLCNGRPEERDGEKLIGLFLNTVPVRIQLKGGTWQELVRLTFDAELEVMPYRRFPLAEIQKLLGGNPVFESAFDFVHFHVYRDLQGCRGITLSEGHYFEANDLPAFTTFMLDTTSTVLQMHIDYDPNLLCREQIEQMSHYYIATLRAMAAKPEGRYESFSPLSDVERDRILVQFNQSKADYPRNLCLHQLISARAAEMPNSIAVISDQETLTYAQLDKASDALAGALCDLKISPDMPVAVYMERSASIIVALLGILKAGGAYVPLDPAFPKERLTFMLKDSLATVTVTQRSFLEALPGETRAVCVDTPASPRAATALPRSVLPDNLAYLIYTSGSTGTPKGVQITHRSVVNLLLSAARTASVGPDDRLLAVTTLSFDIAGLELFMPLLLGGSVVIANRETASDASDLAQLITTSGATIMQATPATWRMLIESGWEGKHNLKAFCGGEALSQSLAVQLLARTRELWNFYGPTETTIWSSAARILPDQTITVGKPLANTQMYTLDHFMAPVPLCATGELYIGGDGLARGYWQRPELTSERFTKNPFWADPASRLYKTGDLARFLPDGTIECLGRLDHQVKIRGFRIELGEVEHALRQHPGVRNAVVRAKKDSFGENRLVAYITHTGSPDVAELRAFLQTRIPAYMVPGHFVRLEAFPLTPNGKIDVKKLPEPEGALPSHAYTAPRDTHEEKLAGIWRQALSVPRIGIEDNFFDLGCDSLSATRAFARINQDFGSEIHLRDIFENPTIAGLASVVKARGAQTRVDIPITPRARRQTAKKL